MRRCLIHYDDGRTWDLVIEGDGSFVEYRHADVIRRWPLAEFAASEDGKKFASQLA